jgi:hypothetical protein
MDAEAERASDSADQPGSGALDAAPGLAWIVRRSIHLTPFGGHFSAEFEALATNAS